MINIIDRFLKTKIFPYLSIGYIFLVFFGYAVNVAFYGGFNIDILNYLSPTEILIPTINIGITIIIFSVYVFYMLINVFMSAFDKEEKSLKKNSNQTYWKTIAKDKKSRRWVLNLSILIFLIPLAIVSFVGNLTVIHYSFLGVILSILAIIWFPVFYILIRLYKEKTKEQELPSFLWFVPIFFFILTLVSANQISKVQSLYDGNKIAQISISSNNEAIIETNDTIMYIGQTSSHMFFWNFYNEEPEILDLSNFSKTIKINTTRYISGILNPRRSYEKHPLFNYINETSNLNLRIKDVMRRSGASIYNRKVIIPEHTGLIDETHGLAKGTPLSEINPPYQLIKKSGFKLLVVKNKDTLLFAAGKAID